MNSTPFKFVGRNIAKDAFSDGTQLKRVRSKKVMLSYVLLLRTTLTRALTVRSSAYIITSVCLLAVPLGSIKQILILCVIIRG